MTLTSTFNEISKYVNSLPVISSHEHHMPDSFHQNLNLDLLLENSYIGWYVGRTKKSFDEFANNDDQISVSRKPKIYLLPSDNPQEKPRTLSQQRSEFLDRHGYNSYMVWLEKGLQAIYGYEDSLKPENWDWISQQISTRHKNPTAHLEILKHYGNYIHAVQDSYWDYGYDLDHPDFFSPTMRVDMFVTSCHPTMLDHDRNSPFISYPDIPTSNFVDYLDYLKELFTKWRQKGAVAMKSASAYERTIQYNDISFHTAKQLFYKTRDEISQEDRLIFGDFMFNWFCKLCMELEVPFQIHTGLAELSGSHPLFFESTIARYPAVKFVLFHSGYPWYADILGLAHNYDNVFIDMVWAPIISTSGAVDALHQYIEVAQSSDLIGWGSDTWTSEEAVGATLAWRFVVAKVLVEKIESGYLDYSKAENLAKKLMYLNNAKLYKLDF